MSADVDSIRGNAQGRHDAFSKGRTHHLQEENLNARLDNVQKKKNK